MKPTTVERLRRPFARAEAWKRYAFRQQDRAAEFEARWQDAEMYAIRSENEIAREAIREAERDAREDARAAYGEGYQKGREDASGGDW